MAYTRGKKIKVSAKFEINPPLSSPITGITVQAEISGLGKIEAKNQTLNGSTYDFPAAESETNLPADATKIIDPLTINWKVAQDDSADFTDVGKSSNKLYVTLNDPYNYASKFTGGIPYTLLKLGIGSGGATDAATATDITWAGFSNRNVTTWDGRKMYYYKNEPNNVIGFLGCGSYDLLIQTNPDSGLCSAFATLFMGALAVNGVPANLYTVRATDGTEMVIKNWAFTSTSPPPPLAPPEYQWKLKVNSGDRMVPALDQYGDLTNSDGMAGQNTGTPSEKIFRNHEIVKIQDTQNLQPFYDPSYGLRYKDMSDFEKQAVEGYARDFSEDIISENGHDYKILRVRKVDGALNITPTSDVSNTH